jgi:hypothetical protein
MAFRRGVLALLGRVQPAGVLTLTGAAPPPFGPRPHQSEPTTDPDEIGVVLATRVLETSSPEHRRRLRAAMEDAFKQITAIHERRARGESNGK